VDEAYVRQALGPDQLTAPAAAKVDERSGDALEHPRFPILGAFGLLLASLAFVSAQVPFLFPAALPLAGVGLVTGFAGLWATRPRSPGGWLVTLAGASASLAGVLVMVFWPNLLGLGYGAPETAAPTFDRKAVYSYEQKTNLGRDREDAEWLDARKYFVQQGIVRIRVDWARLQRVSYQHDKTSRLTSDKKLVIGLRVIAMRPAPKVRYAGWWVKKGEQDVAARLIDSTDRSYSLAVLPPGSVAAGQLDAAGDLPPGKFIKDLIVFEPPAPGFQYLRLELPAAAFGGTGTLRFQLNRSMVRER
jgi:hypothetical protein